MLSDTTDEAREVQLAVWRRMTPAERIALGAEMSEQAFRVAASGIARRHPDYTPDDVEWALKRLRVGDELFRAAWPGVPLLDP